MNNFSVSSLCYLKHKGFFLNYFKNLQIVNLELAPTMVSSKLDKIELKVFKKKLIKENKKIVAIQSIFFNSNLNIEEENFDIRFQSHMKKIKSICKIFDCKQINFGSSNLRSFINLKKKKCLEQKFLKSIRKFLIINKKLNINLEPIKSSRKNNYLFQNYNDCLRLIKKSKLKNLKILYDFYLAKIYKFKPKSIDIKKKLYGHVHINDLNLKRNLNFKDIKRLKIFLDNSFDGYYSFEKFLNKRELEVFERIYGKSK